jgi:hypothetical protein
MSYLKFALSLAVAVSFGACTASSQPSASADQAHSEHIHKTSGAIATVKPGASVTIESVLPKVMASGSFQPVQLRFDEAYDSGTLTVSIEPSAGLSLFGGSSSKTFDLASPETHVWDLDVKADVDGVYFLNVFAEADGQPRVFSVRLDMGQVTQKMFDDAMPADGKMSDGGKIRILEANETIK